MKRKYSTTFINTAFIAWLRIVLNLKKFGKKCLKTVENMIQTYSLFHRFRSWLCVSPIWASWICYDFRLKPIFVTSKPDSELAGQLKNSQKWYSSSYINLNLWNTLYFIICSITISDVTLMDDPSWAVFSLPLIETQCEASIWRQSNKWRLKSGTKPPQEIIDVLNCPNLCSGHGICNGKKCLCQPGWTGPSCSCKFVVVMQTFVTVCL